MSQVQFSGPCSQDSGSEGRKSEVSWTQFQGPSSRVLSVRGPGLRISGPGSQVLILDYALILIAFGKNTNIPLGTGRKFNVHKTLRRRPGLFLNVLYTFSLRLVPRGLIQVKINPLKVNFIFRHYLSS